MCLFYTQLFLYLICSGVIIFAFGFVPFPVIGTTVWDDEDTGQLAKRMAFVCSATIWLRAFGFSVIVSALFANTYRSHKVSLRTNGWNLMSPGPSMIPVIIINYVRFYLSANRSLLKTLFFV